MVEAIPLIKVYNGNQRTTELFVTTAPKLFKKLMKYVSEEVEQVAKNLKRIK